MDDESLNPGLSGELGPSRAEFWSVFWPALCAVILAVLLITVGVLLVAVLLVDSAGAVPLLAPDTLNA